jgi:hypothetical protein
MYRMDDGTIAVLSADPVISVSLALLARGEAAGVTVSDDGMVVFGGTVRYLPAMYDLKERALVCWQVPGERRRMKPFDQQEGPQA